MTWIDDNKDSGPFDLEKDAGWNAAGNKDLGAWNFTEQGDKFGYLNNPRWSNNPKGAADSISATEFCEEKGISLDPEDTHRPCGHWHKQGAKITLSDEYVFIVDSAGHLGGIEDVLIKKEKHTFPVLDWQGGKGTGIENYYCPHGCCVDEQYVWVADFHNNRMMVRDKFDLTYVNHYYGFIDLEDVAVDDNYTYDVDYSLDRLAQRDKTDMDANIVKQLKGGTYPPFYTEDIRCRLNGPLSVDVDETYVYVTEIWNHRILKVFKSDFSYVDSWGYGSETFSGPEGIATDGTYLYVGDCNTNHVSKVRISDKEPVAVIGHTNTGDGDGEFGQIYGVAVGDTHVYVCEMSNQRIQKILKSDMSFVSKTTQVFTGWPVQEGDIRFPIGIAVEDDESFIYVADWHNMITKFDSDFNFVAWSGDPTGQDDDGENAYSLPTWVAIDTTYLYIVDLYNARVVKRLKSTLAYVSEYDYSDWVDFSRDPAGIACDGTYVYLVCSGGATPLHRINAATMTYIDSFSNSPDSYIPQGLCCSGTSLYMTDWGMFRGHVDVFDTTNLAGGLQDTFWDGWKFGDYILNNPYGIAVDADYVYVTDSRDMRYGRATDWHGIHKINKKTGVIVASQDTYNIDGVSTEFQYPTHIAVDENYVFVTERSNGISVSVYNKDDLSWVYTDVTGINGQYCYPYGICIYYPYGDLIYDADGNVVDSWVDLEPQVWSLPTKGPSL